MDTVGTEYYSVPDPTPPTVPAFRRACGRLPDAGFPCVSERTVFSIRSHTRAAVLFSSVPRSLCLHDITPRWAETNSVNLSWRKCYIDRSKRE